MSCPSAGNCAADGFFVSSTVDPFIVEETNGRWDLANTVNGMPELNVGQNAGASSISCATPGSCAAAGSYTDAHGDHPSWISYVNSKGFWNPALAEPGISGDGRIEPAAGAVGLMEVIT